MRITYRVIDKRTDKDITNDYAWVISPDGRLAYNDYGDLTGLDFAEAVVTMIENTTPPVTCNHIIS